MIQRAPKYYTAGLPSSDPAKAPFYLRALVFDGDEGDFNTLIINEFNDLVRNKYSHKLDYVFETKETTGKVPSKIIVINASHDNLPTSYETARIFEDLCRERGINIPAKVVNKREELIREIGEKHDEILIISQCVDKNIYNIVLAEELGKKGVVLVPGETTAPGGVFSDKDSTYRLLSDNGKDWDEVARYRKVSVEDRSIEEVIDGIFDAVEGLIKETGDSTFFVKPHEGGGGLGGFRITKKNDGYIIPDLSKVSGDASNINPTLIDFDIKNEAKLRELLWVYRLFSSDKRLSENYIKVELSIGEDDEGAVQILKDYLIKSEGKQEHKLNSMVMDKQDAHDTLVKAVKIYEKKFNRRYMPLVNEHLDFGLWGLRAHYRLSTKGVILETIYHRVFQLAFTEEGLGYVGSDNISNKQTGELEILRLGPINETMVEAIGGKTALFDTLEKGVKALMILSELVPEEERTKVPLRLQLDLAAISQRIGEGNADTARGLSIASKWDEFERNTKEWLEDSLRYYAWKKK